MQRPQTDDAARVEGAAGRLIVYALPDARRRIDDAAATALRALRPHAERLVVLTAGPVGAHVDTDLLALADVVDHHEDRVFTRSLYRDAVDAARADLPVREIVLTGATWFGPRQDGAEGIGGIVEAMAASSAEVWELVEQTESLVRDFARQGFPLREEPYLWLAVRGGAIAASFWSEAGHSAVAPRAATAGFATDALFTAAQTGTVDPALLSVPHLLAAGIPVLPRRPFVQYPPFLEQYAVIGREILAAAAVAGFDIVPVLAALARTMPPKALNVNLGLLEVIPDAAPRVPAPAAPPRLLVLMHVTDLDSGAEAFRRLAFLPPGFDIVVTTSDGARATVLTRMVDESLGGRAVRREVRVSPANRGRDMSALLIASRDLLLSGEHDLILRLRCRPMSSSTRVVRHYFRRYEFENLLASEAHVARILDLFRQEPGLGMVFPPMIHIGFQTLGRGWGAVRDRALRLARTLGIEVPLDVVSPLAPFGGMFFARPEAIAPLARVDWSYRQYAVTGSSRRGGLAQLQERMLTAVAAEQGFHARTVLTPEHAAISHTALEFKADEIAATTRGYAVDRIELLHRAGTTGRGGVVGLSRMYLRLNHPRLSRLVLPLMAAAEVAFLMVKTGATRVRHAAQERGGER